jgi:hypothetical protein
MTISARPPTPASWRIDQRALDAVEAEREELDNFVAEIKVSEVGKDASIRGKNAKQAKLDRARAELKATAAPAPVSKKRGKLMTFEQALPSLEREQNARFIEKIVVKPIGSGRRAPVSERVEVWWVGSEEPYDLTEYLAPAADLTAEEGVG